ncbi:conserved hypothetical protein [Coccidioides posadasii str. Silveira]|uniref:Uncharacterized protein n=1 Tax=Coccidioides posadasii (strain RMSCC 757 / Silveira) TaxID=443226 RepID=E9DIX8_COCPS|nr:conserved hypothetical protein [Coccidioides posadasii str. Silveira]
MADERRFQRRPGSPANSRSAYWCPIVIRRVTIMLVSVLCIEARPFPKKRQKKKEEKEQDKNSTSHRLPGQATGRRGSH